MILNPGLARGHGFEPPLCNLFPICLFESLGRTLFGLFDSPCIGMRLHMREGVKDMIFILNPNPTSLSL